jgi:hypothetical protein
MYQIYGLLLPLPWCRLSCLHVYLIYLLHGIHTDWQSWVDGGRPEAQ